MNRFIKKTLMALSILPAILIANNPSKTIKTHNLAIYHTVTGNVEKEYNTLAEKELKSIGFNLTDPYKRVNDQYEAKWGSTTLDALSFMPIVRDRTILPLLNIDPRIAVFAPFNLVLHKKLNDNVSYVGHLVPEVMLDILGIDNAKVRKKFSAPFKALDATIAQKFGGDVRTIPYKALPQKTILNYELEFKTEKDLENFINEFQNKFEIAFTNKGYLIAGYHNFMDATPDASTILSDYNAFWTYSLCHLEFSHTIFDTEGARPEAALFAPCTMYMYIKKGTNKLILGMLSLDNWQEILDMKNKKRVQMIHKLNTEIPAILKHLGLHAIKSINPLKETQSLNKPITDKQATATQVKVSAEKIMKSQKENKQKATSKNQHVEKIKIGNKIVTIAIPKVPKVIKCNSSSYNAGSNRGIKFSKRTPPNYKPHSFDKALKSKTSAHTRIGEVNHGKISAYLRGKYMTADTAKKKLKDAGFDIITAVPVNKKGDLTSIVFTDKQLTDMSSKKDRGFMASLRLLIDDKAKTISITNPLYMAKGFMQDDFDETVAHKILVRLTTHFTELTNSKDTLKFQLLPNYQFMKGMPHYQDMVDVASGDTLLEKVKKNKNVVFIQTLSNGATLVGIKLSKRTRKFTKKIGRNNAAMLPYPILIEKGKAKILDPKYYISFMYPMLTMSEFMTIATVPDAMLKDCEKIFK